MGDGSRYEFSRLTATFTKEEFGGYPVQLCLVASQGSPAAKSGHFVGRYLGSDPKSPHHFAAIRTWLDGCLNHPACEIHLSGSRSIDPRNSPLPTRCVELIEGRTFQLSETGNKVGSYITLTHRWNEETPAASTTMSNLEERRIGRGWETLTKTFLDTIEVARRMRIQYVWIDSICIVQSGDDQKDWNLEASKMAVYYRNSLMTVAAVDASKEDGFLLARAKDAMFKRLVRLPYFDVASVPKGHIFVYIPEFDASKSHYDTYNRGLLTRGWVFQEWLLSRRILYFAKNQLVFECQSRRPKNENNEVLFAEESSGFSTYQSVLKMKYAIREESQKGVVPDRFSTWYTIVEKYSQQTLTFPEKDYVVAISGLAQEFRNTLASANERVSANVSLEYVSGLWLEDIHYGLLWHLKDRVAAEDAKAQVSTASSWSWCSLLLPIFWLPRRARTRNEMQVIGLKTTEGHMLSVDGNSPVRGVQYLRELAPQQDNSGESDTEDMGWSRLAPGSLLVRGRLTPVYIGTNLSTKDLRLVANVPGHSFHTVPADSSKAWRIVVSPQETGIIAGYGSFERPQIQKQLCRYETTVVLALHISSTDGVGLVTAVLARVLGLEIPVVYNVLFLEPQGRGKYSRLGVGSIFDTRLQGILKAAGEEVIELV